MPMITLKVAAEENEEIARELARTITQLTAKVLRKDPQVTAVAIEFIPAQRWFTGDRSALQRGVTSFFLETRITAGTNSGEEKARYVASAHAAIAAILGGAHEESYVHVHEVSADGYGYGGQTQAQRHGTR
jgi:4-oxalocrotonate tautomerase